LSIIKQQLLQHALLGTDKKPVLPNDLPATVQALTDRATPSDDAAEKLLYAAGLMTLYQRAGQGAVPVTGNPAAAQEQVSFCPPDMMAAWQLIGGINAKHPVLEQLWLEKNIKKAWVAPPEVLVSLWKTGTKHNRLRPLIRAVAGLRGAWMAAQQEDWQWMAATYKDETDAPKTKKQPEQPPSHDAIAEELAQCSAFQTDRIKALLPVDVSHWSPVLCEAFLKLLYYESWNGHTFTLAKTCWPFMVFLHPDTQPEAAIEENNPFSTRFARWQEHVVPEIQQILQVKSIILKMV
jgi:Family of unknown function (DUF5691)